jgi:hypothetical protein
MQNREVFYEDPTTRDLPNLGVARVSRPESEQEWETLRFELSHFVCEGEYERGLDRILSTFLGHLEQPKQPGVWVSGFYGSGKSHFLRVLENIWVDTKLRDGGTARGITHLPTSVQDGLLELTNAAKRTGGLWAAAGTLGTGASGSVRLAFLRVLFEAAGLPAQYAPARFVIWLKQQGMYESVSAAVERLGRTLAREVNNLYVAQALPQALLEVRPDFAEDAAAVRLLLKEQFPTRTDIDEDEAMRTARDVFELQSTLPGSLPLTLIVLDEMQQYLGEDAQKTLDVDALAQAVSAEFESQVLLVAAGQSAMGATPALQKLKDRFTVYVQLSDTDVETVIRKVVLQKKPDKQADLAGVLDGASGEIGRHLGGSRLAATSADGEYLSADYPMLPTRRRFWEHVLRALDRGGTQGQLRTQLRMAQEAAKSVGHQALGNVVGADFIYDQQSSGMLQSGVLLKDTNEQVLRLRQHGPNGELQSRIGALVFMIDRLREVNPELGVAANADTLGDLLVTDLTTSSIDFRNRVSDELKRMAEAGLLAVTDGQYALVDEETQRWLGEYKQNRSSIEGDSSIVAAAREERVRAAVGDALRSLVVTQGKSKTARRIEIGYSTQPPAAQGATVPVWVRAEWDVIEKRAREEANELGNESPVVTVLLLKNESDALRTQIVRYAAARKTVDDRPMPATEEGIRARKTIESERDAANAKVQEILGRILAGARVFLPAGNDEAPGNLKAAVQGAAEKALVRLFPRFDEADSGSWPTVSKRVLDGAGDALGAVGYQGSPEKHPVCAEILAFIKASGTKGTEVRQKFEGVGFGWPPDAVNAGLLVLLQAGHMKAELNGLPATVAQFTLTQVGKATYRRESVLPPTTEQLIQLRSLLTKAGVTVKPGDETAGVVSFLQKLIDTASAVGGDAPLPPRPDTSLVHELQQLTGNELSRTVWERRDGLEKLHREFSDAVKEIGLRVPRWDQLGRLMKHAAGLAVTAEVAPQVEAIRIQRCLLDDPDPVLPLLDDVRGALRTALAKQVEAFEQVRQDGIAELSRDESFTALPDGRKKSLVEECGLRAVDMPDPGTDQGLLAALDAMPLELWRVRTDGLSVSFARAREIAAKEAVHAVKVTPPPATLKDAPGVDAYLQDLRLEIMGHIDGGNPVVI